MATPSSTGYYKRPISFTLSSRMPKTPARSSILKRKADSLFSEDALFRDSYLKLTIRLKNRFPKLRFLLFTFRYIIETPSPTQESKNRLLLRVLKNRLLSPPQRCLRLNNARASPMSITTSKRKTAHYSQPKSFSQPIPT